MNEILNLPIQENDAGAKTIGEYLMILFLKLWSEEESFSGKRPFGNSGWKYELYPTLIKNGFIDGKLDEEYGDIISVDRDSANDLIIKLIESLFKGK